MMYRNFGRDDPVGDWEELQRAEELAVERARKKRVIKCTAALWLTFEHATAEEAMAEANDFFAQLFRNVDDSDFTCEEDV